MYFATQHYFYYDGDSVEIGLTDWISWSQPEVWVYPRSDLQYAQWRNVHQFSGVNGALALCYDNYATYGAFVGYNDYLN